MRRAAALLVTMCRPIPLEWEIVPPAPRRMYPSPPESLFRPRIAVHVIAVLLPESRRIRGPQLDAANPLGTFPQIEPRHQPPQRPAMLRGQIFSIPRISENTIVRDKFLQRNIHRETGLAVTHH